MIGGPGPEGALRLIARLRMMECDHEFAVEIARIHGFTVADLTGSSRVRPISKVRCLVAALLRARGRSYADIGAIINRTTYIAEYLAQQFFDRDIRDALVAESWRILAPHGFEKVTSFEALQALAEHQATEPTREAAE